jgi:aryl-alcohol dehydrogenase-like predicted oxidoreductase
VSVAQLEQARTVVDITVNAIKLAWLLRRSPVVLPIPGTRSIEHLRENLAALEIDLGDVAA